MRGVIGHLMKWFGPRHLPVVVAVASVAILVTGGTFAVLASSSGPQWAIGHQSLATASEYTDADGDGLPDALENRIGSDPREPATLGGDVSDGWLYHWYGSGVDWNDTRLLEALALVAPTQELPDPLQNPGSIIYPTVAALHQNESTLRGYEGSWWTKDALDPRQWDNNGDGIADAWLLQNSLDPLDVEADGPAPGDPAMELQEKYQLGLNPAAADTDGDGLDDLSEIVGRVSFGTQDFDFDPTDPLEFSSRDDGIADGYIVRFGLDARDPTIASNTPAGDGVTVREAYLATLASCQEESSTCDWAKRLRTGPLVDPTGWDSLGDGVADAWALRDPLGITHPLRDARSTVLYDTSSWDASPWNQDAWDGSLSGLRGLVVDADNPTPDPAVVHASDAYAYLRPGNWDESRDGPWWGGLDTQVNASEGSLPAAVALRGWELNVDIGLGRNGTNGISQADLVTVHATADPRKTDTDGDGITDTEEYFGVFEGQPGFRTDPSDVDTDGDGLEDAKEFEHKTSPLRRDSSGSFLMDGPEVDLWMGNHTSAIEAYHADPTGAEETYQWLLRPDERIPGARVGIEHFDRLLPGGDLDGDGRANVLDDDADGDGLRDGAETDPRNLNRPSKHGARPATDPARVDTDGDGLPDGWEVFWSKDEFYQCPSSKCTHQASVPGWPIDPSLWNSVLELESASDGDAGAVGDWDLNMAGDSVRTAPDPNAVEPFSNGIAYAYGLHPFLADSSPDDGIPDMFALHWGVNNVPAFAADTIQQDIVTFDWAVKTAGRVTDELSKRGLLDQAPPVAVMDPYPNTLSQVDAETNLLGMFTARQKGTWIARPDLAFVDGSGPDPAECGTDHLPGPDPAAHTPAMVSRHEGQGYGDTDIPSRVGLSASCWQWISYPIRSDIDNRTDPWHHDFDHDGIPDAWEGYYGVQSESAGGPTPASHGTDCADGLEGLPSLSELGLSSYCITLVEAYRLGIDPNDKDTDQGGLEDWVEVALGLDALDPDDDRGEEDWDGDGVLNWIEDLVGTSRISPDRDGDGLLDGYDKKIDDMEKPLFVDTGTGAGDLCLRRGEDNVTGMTHRPSGAILGAGTVAGNLTHTQLFEHYQRLGVLYSPASAGVCDDMPTHPEPYFVFHRESALDWWRSGAPELLGSGTCQVLECEQAATDPLQWDTSGDGIPDGWLVYWRIQASGSSTVQRGLDPVAAGGAGHLDPDQDGVINAEEYASARPSDWNEDRDGPWWGGTSPGAKDTDGDKAWHDPSIPGEDFLDPDNDADGIPDRIDPYPGIDTSNNGTISWNASQERYGTDYPALWLDLAQRASAHATDRDGDSVPDFLDRARIRIEDVEATRGGLPLSHATKGEDTFLVSGTVVLHESPAGQRTDSAYDGSPTQPDPAADGDAVRGATVKAILSDGSVEVVVGYAFTDAEGGFSIAAGLDGSTTGPPAPQGGASIDGILMTPGQSLSLPDLVPSLTPGPVTLWVAVEPNDPDLQPVVFGPDSRTHVKAYKETSPEPYRIPAGHPGSQNPVLGAVTLKPGTDEPNGTNDLALHGAEAIFGGHSAEHPFTLRGIAKLHGGTPPQGGVLLGKDLVVSGKLLDSSDVALPDRNVTVRFLDDAGNLVQEEVRVTDASGAFQVSMPTHGLDPGPYRVNTSVELLSSDGFLQLPAPKEEFFFLSQNTRWALSLTQVDSSFLLDGAEVLLPSGSTSVDAGTGFTVQARLIDDVNGLPVEGRDVTMSVKPINGGVELDSVSLVTNGQGWANASFDPLPASVPLGRLILELDAGDKTPLDLPASGQAFLEPFYSTRVELDNTTLDTGAPGSITGRLLRIGAADTVAPVVHPGAVLIAESSHAERLLLTGTGDDGTFRIPVESDLPATINWSVRFAGLPEMFLQPSGWAQATSTHVADVSIVVDPHSALRDREVALTGQVSLAGGQGHVPGAMVEAWWEEGTEATVGRTRADRDGRFNLTLPPRSDASTYVARIQFLGSPIHHALSTAIEVDVKAPVQIDLDIPAPVVGSDGTVHDTLHGRLSDEKGPTLAARSVRVTFTDPMGSNTTLQRVTDSDGAFAIAMDTVGLRTPGAWHVLAEYAGNTFETTAYGNGTMQVVHQVEVDLLRAPTAVDPGATMILEGITKTHARGLDTIRLEAYLGDTRMGGVDVQAQQPWALSFTTPDLPRGEYDLVVTGTPHDGIMVIPARSTILVTSLFHASWTEVWRDDDSRTVLLEATHTDGRPASGVELVVGRIDASGGIVGIHESVTDDRGRLSLDFDAHQDGNLTVLALRDPSLRLQETRTVVPAPPPGTSGVPLLWVSLFSVAAASSLVVAYMVWRRRHRQTLGEVFHDAQKSLMDPDASPAEIIRRAYQRVLSCLTQAGYTPSDEETVRDIAMSALSAFHLPTGSMKRVTSLFELAVYSDRDMTAHHRDEALAAFRALSRTLQPPHKHLPEDVHP